MWFVLTLMGNLTQQVANPYLGFRLLELVPACIGIEESHKMNCKEMNEIASNVVVDVNLYPFCLSTNKKDKLVSPTSRLV